MSIDTDKAPRILTVITSDKMSTYLGAADMAACAEALKAKNLGLEFDEAAYKEAWIKKALFQANVRDALGLDSKDFIKKNQQILLE